MTLNDRERAAALLDLMALSDADDGKRRHHLTQPGDPIRCLRLLAYQSQVYTQYQIVRREEGRRT